MLGISRSKYELEQPTVKSLVRQHGCAGRPNSKLVPKPSTIRSKHTIYLHVIVLIVFLFCHMFQIKRLNSACSVLYLTRY